MDTTTIPKVSILIPVYNRKNLISATLDSALAQTFRDIEVVVVDNCSSDGTWSVLQEYSQKDPRVKIFRNITNIGPVRNWKVCLDKACGEYGKILWSDDLIAPEFLEKTLPYLSDPNVGFVYTKVRIFGGDKDLNLYSIGKTGKYDSSDFIYGSLLNGDFPASPGAAIFRLKDLRANLLLDIPNKLNLDFPTAAIGNDLLIYLIAAAQYPNFAYVDEALSFFRSHSNSISIVSRKGKLELFYKTATAFFVTKYIKDAALIRKFNANLLIAKLFRGVNLSSIDEFYPETSLRPVDWFFFLGILTRKLFQYLGKYLCRR